MRPHAIIFLATLLVLFGMRALVSQAGCSTFASLVTVGHAGASQDSRLSGCVAEGVAPDVDVSRFTISGRELEHITRHERFIEQFRRQPQQNENASNRSSLQRTARHARFGVPFILHQSHRRRAIAPALWETARSWHLRLGN